MNLIVQMGRLTKDPDTRYTSGENATCIAKFSLAVDRRFKKKDDNTTTTDFFQWTSFGKLAEFCEKFLKKGTKVVITGRIENNNFKNKDGEMVYSNQFIAENIEFAESKKAAEANGTSTAVNNKTPDNAEWMNVPDVDESELPFR